MSVYAHPEGPFLIDRTTVCADCGAEGIQADTAQGEIVADGRVVAQVPERDLILLASAHGDREAVCDECEAERANRTDAYGRRLGAVARARAHVAALTDEQARAELAELAGRALAGDRALVLEALQARLRS